MKTIAQQLKLTELPFIIKDKKGNQIYFEDSDNFWRKKEFDKNSNEIYYEDSNSVWIKCEFDENSNEIYHETSDGSITDNRPKPIQEYTMEELTKILGKEFKLIK